MPFGLAILLKLFDQVLHDLNFCDVYIDNVLIASSTADKHKAHVHLGFQEYGVIVNPLKCQLGVSQLSFLGHNANG